MIQRPAKTRQSLFPCSREELLRRLPHSMKARQQSPRQQRYLRTTQARSFLLDLVQRERRTVPILIDVTNQAIHRRAECSFLLRRPPNQSRQPRPNIVHAAMDRAAAGRHVHVRHHAFPLNRIPRCPQLAERREGRSLITFLAQPACDRGRLTTLGLRGLLH